jgi:hypothetical protein
MLHIQIDSSFLKSVAFDNNTQQLEIHFQNGSEYTYVEVPLTTYEAMMNAASIGRFYQQNIKGKFKTLSRNSQNKNQMADKIIKLKIDVTKIKKEWLFKGEKGLYADLTLLYNEEKDQYENNGVIVQDVPKKIYEADKGAKGPILGNGKVLIFKGAGDDAKNATQVGSPSDLPDDLPF